MKKSLALLHIDYDDGFVAYLNGVEIARTNIGVPGIPPSYNQSASAVREAEIYGEDILKNMISIQFKYWFMKAKMSPQSRFIM